MDPLKIFIGTSNANRVEQQVLIRSIKRRTTIPFEIYYLNGDTSVISGPSGDVEVRVPGTLKAQYVTRFTAMRFQVPAVCGYRGQSLYVDSDQLVFTDLGALVKSVPPSQSFGAVRVSEAWSARRFKKLVLDQVAPEDRRGDYYMASVWLMNNEQCRFDLESIGESVASGRVTYNDLIWLGPQFRAAFGLTAHAISPSWNCLDDLRPDSNLLHFTDLSMQPWRHPHNPNSRVWLEQFVATVREGGLSEQDLRDQHNVGRLSWATLMRGLEALGKPSAPHAWVRAREFVRGAYWELFWQLKLAALMLKRSLQH